MGLDDDESLELEEASEPLLPLLDDDEEDDD